MKLIPCVINDTTMNRLVQNSGPEGTFHSKCRSLNTKTTFKKVFGPPSVNPTENKSIPQVAQNVN